MLTYGVMGGIGLGAAYITPIAMLSKWFPDKRGLITGIAVGGFGFGAVITAPVAKALLGGTDDKPSVFLPLGVGYLIAVLIGASFFRNPPAGYAVPGFVPKTTGRTVAGSRVYTIQEALRTRQWYQLTAILALNTTAGIALISQASDAAQDIAGASAAAAAGLVGTLGLFNGAGRVFWAGLSDRFGRMTAFLGTPNAGAIYGAMIVAWSIGGVVGPLLTALLYEASGQSYTLPFTVIAVVAAAALVLPLLTRMPSSPEAALTPKAARGARTGAP